MPIIPELIHIANSQIPEDTAGMIGTLLMKPYVIAFGKTYSAMGEEKVYGPITKFACAVLSIMVSPLLFPIGYCITHCSQTHNTQVDRIRLIIEARLQNRRNSEVNPLIELPQTRVDRTELPPAAAGAGAVDEEIYPDLRFAEGLRNRNLLSKHPLTDAQRDRLQGLIGTTAEALRNAALSTNKTSVKEFLNNLAREIQTHTEFSTGFIEDLKKTYERQLRKMEEHRVPSAVRGCIEDIIALLNDKASSTDLILSEADYRELSEGFSQLYVALLQMHDEATSSHSHIQATVADLIARVEGLRTGCTISPKLVYKTLNDNIQAIQVAASDCPQTSAFRMASGEIIRKLIEVKDRELEVF